MGFNFFPFNFYLGHLSFLCRIQTPHGNNFYLVIVKKKLDRFPDTVLLQTSAFYRPVLELVCSEPWLLSSLLRCSLLGWSRSYPPVAIPLRSYFIRCRRQPYPLLKLPPQAIRYCLPTTALPPIELHNNQRREEW